MEALVEFGRKEFCRPKRLILLGCEAKNCTLLRWFRGNGFFSTAEGKTSQYQGIFFFLKEEGEGGI